MLTRPKYGENENENNQRLIALASF